jgi:hypothetical protein
MKHRGKKKQPYTALSLCSDSASVASEGSPTPQTQYDHLIKHWGGTDYSYPDGPPDFKEPQNRQQRNALIAHLIGTHGYHVSLFAQAENRDPQMLVQETTRIYLI